MRQPKYAPVRVVVGFCLLFAACSVGPPTTSSDAPESAREPAPSTVSVPDSAPSPGSDGSPATEAPPPDTTPAPAAPTAADLCDGSDPNDTGPLPRPELDEISGLVRATTLSGYWMHMDGREAPGVWALGDDNADRGFTRIGIDMSPASDFEDIALSGRGYWPQLILADIGDNRRQRDSINLVAIDEPFPGTESVPVAWVLNLTYPDGPRDAETLVVDDEGGYLVIVTKEEIRIGDTEEFDALPSRIYQTPLPPPGDDEFTGETRELEFVGEIDTPSLASKSWATRLHPLTLLGRAGSVTGGDITSTGRVIGLRTYGTIWMWDRPPGTLVSEALLGEPCEAPAAFEIQGEAVAFVGDTDWATIGEGVSPEVNVTRQR